jgi:hypothetical protein
MLSSIYKYIIAILGIGLAIMTALFYRGQAVHQKAMRKGVEQVRETEKKAQSAIDRGRKREKEARDEAKSAITNRTFFG